ncbi:hypothetical protein ERO13_A08G021208v2 [Gossypium hirsutum]|nr:hypothetical protein ERO13_A08G021208v2 [Gossypium hirsutum]
MAPTSPPVVEPPKQSSVLPGPSPWPAHSPKHHGHVAGPALAPSSPSPLAEPPKQSSPGPAYSPKHHGPVAGPVLAPTYPPPPHVAEPPKQSSASPAHSPKHHAPTLAPTNPPPPPPKQLSPPLPSTSPQDSTPSPASDLTPAVPPSKSFATSTSSSVIVLAASVLLSMVFSTFVGVF